MELLLAPENIFFTTSLGLLLAIALLEGIGTLMGFAFMGLIDGILPSIDLDIGAGVEVGHPLSMGKLMSWLQVGKVPAILILLAFLASFGLAGIAIQTLSASLFGGYLPIFMAVPSAFAMSLPFTRVSARILSVALPKDESSAVSHQSLIGRTATIVLGTARKGNAVEAKVRDIHGKTHYIMVEPENEQDEFPQGSTILLVKKTGSIFFGITPTNNLLNENDY